MLSQIHAPALQHFRNRVCLRLICFTLFSCFFWVLKMNKKGCELCPPARGFLQGLVHEADPGVSRAMKPDMDLGVFAAWLLFFFGQVSRDMRFARIMTSERPERASTPSSILYPAPAPTATCTPNTTKKNLTTNHHINIINNSNSIPVPKHVHRFSTDAYNKKPHQNSANLGNVKK